MERLDEYGLWVQILDELLTDGNATEAQTVQAYGTVILKNVEHMEKLLNDLKLTYQLEAGAIPFTLQQVRGTWWYCMAEIFVSKAG